MMTTKDDAYLAKNHLEIHLMDKTIRSYLNPYSVYLEQPLKKTGKELFNIPNVYGNVYLIFNGHLLCVRHSIGLLIYHLIMMGLTATPKEIN